MSIKKIDVGGEYDVIIDEDLLGRLGEFLPQDIVGERTAIIVTDSNVAPLYLETVKKSLAASYENVLDFVFPAGEHSKAPEILLNLVRFLAHQHVTRSDVIFALGGGVVGDLAGFAAGIYTRGIEYVGLPTSLLAAVDSSVGGKTAVDLPEGKNLIGVFKRPAAVICDIKTFDTLPALQFSCGMGEVIKYAFLSPGFADLIDGFCDNKADISELVSACVRIKSRVVSEDFLDKGARATLNFGHTIGHAVELLSDFSLTHGAAVAVGMAVLVRAEAPALYPRLSAWLSRFSLPERVGYAPEDILRAAKADKKRGSSGTTMVFPHENALGTVFLRKVTDEELLNIITRGIKL